jgi:asparagine synthase (glutamine-hydrolysing)
MSGIVGIVSFDGAPIDRDLLTRLTESMTFRGPDAQLVVTDDHAGFGHTMLRTTNEAATEKQPLTLDGKIWLTADARLDGRDELIEKLELSQSKANDAELILFAYNAWQEKCVDHLIGDFAFAIWNANTQTLFCARDPFGVKPFFYSQIGNTFTFSNTLNTLRLHPSVSDELNETAIADYLAFGLNQDLATTTFSEIHRLPGGHTLSISNRSTIKRRYWTPADLETTSTEDCVERFQDLLTTAAKDRLRTNRVAISMSGGLDSTGLAVIARDLLREDPTSSIHACANVYDSLFRDEERRYSTLAAESIGIPVTHLPCDRYSLFESESATNLKQSEPFLLSPFAAQFNGLLRQLAQHGRVALTGYDGDALLTERPSSYFRGCARKRKFIELAVSMASYVWIFRSLPPVGFRSGVKRMFKKEEVATNYPEWIDEEFAGRVDLRERCREWNAESPATDHRHPSALHVFDSKVWAPLFEGYDPGSTGLPLELRHPFIDVRLIRFVLSLPVVPWCINKHILRRALNDRLPHAILNRSKTPLASDPALHLVKRASVRCLDRFDVNPQLTRFVNLNRRRAVVDEQTSDGRRASLRVFALNHWLTHSLPINRAVRDLLAQTA